VFTVDVGFGETVSALAAPRKVVRRASERAAMADGSSVQGGEGPVVLIRV